MRGPTHVEPTLKLQAATALAHCMYCHEMAPNGTNRSSHQTLVTSLVTNNGPLTRKIRFVTAPTPPIGVCHEYENGTGLVTNLSRNRPGRCRQSSQLPPNPTKPDKTRQPLRNGLQIYAYFAPSADAATPIAAVLRRNPRRVCGGCWLTRSPVPFKEVLPQMGHG